MRIPIAATLAAVAALVAASMLGVASAEAPTGATPTRSVSIEGIGSAPIPQGADAATANNAYRQAMAAALSDGQSKASFLAGKAGGSLGAVLSIVEDGGYVGCTNPGSTESPYAEYEGAQPDIGYARSAPSPIAAATASPSKARAGKPAGKKHRKRRAKKATAASCAVSANLSVAYTLQ
jgi:hypothetical protein